MKITEYSLIRKKNTNRNKDLYISSTLLTIIQMRVLVFAVKLSPDSITHVNLQYV